MKKSHQKQLEHSYRVANPLITLQAAANNGPLLRSEQMEFSFPNCPYGIQTRPALLNASQCTPSARCSIQSTIVAKNRQTPWVVRKRSKTPNIKTRTLLHCLVLSRIRRWKASKRPQKTRNLRTRGSRRYHEVKEEIRKYNLRMNG